MARFHLVHPDDASEEVRAVYADIQREFGRVPTFFKSMALNPSILRGTWEKIRGTLLEGQVPRTVKEMIIVAVSSANNCLYCQEMHSALLGAMGINGDTLAALMQDLTAVELPTRIKLAIGFGVRAATDPAGLSNEDFEHLAQAGFSQAEILELVAVADLAASLNTYADALALPADEFAGTGNNTR
ncbi:MAG: carboxymuconolactone decarboxylase [Chloroflexi bacterium]|nr:MAG: carboxymuconolactone decarboxylase [Chloroflexota bacterium]